MSSRLPARSTGRGLAAGLGSAALVCVVLLPFRSSLNPASPALLLLLSVLAAGLLGSRRAAVLTALLATTATNMLFTRPYGSYKVALADDAVLLGCFGTVALAAGALVASLRERQAQLEHERDTLGRLNERLSEVLAERDRLEAEAERAVTLEREGKERTALLRSVSHDLRTPLATIRGVATDLLGGHHDEATRAELLDLVADEASRLDRLVANLLSLSRVEAGALRPDRRSVDVGELVEERLRRLGRLFRQVRVELDVTPESSVVDGDRTQLEQVVTNLLENAARHAPPASTLRVSVTREPTTGNRAGAHGDVVLRVADEGSGVPGFERERIFEPFRTGEGSTSSGIGLAICRAICEAHDGTIAVGRTPGGGATFTVRLPAA